MTAEGPSPERVGATKRSTLSTRSSARNAAASVGPPSSRSDCTPSAASARELLGERPAPRLEPDASRSRAAREDEPPRLALRRLDVARVEPRAVGAQRAGADGDGVHRGAQLVHAAAALLAGHPALARHGHAPVERRRHLVDHERPPLRHPRAPGLVLHARLEPVDELDVDACRAQLRLPARRLRIRVARGEDDALDPGGEDRVGARRRRARGARTARASRRASRRARARRPRRAPRPRRAGRLPPSLPRRRSRPSRTTTAPTVGFGYPRGPAPLASWSARAMLTSSAARAAGRRACRSSRPKIADAATSRRAPSS